MLREGNVAASAAAAPGIEREKKTPASAKRENERRIRMVEPFDEWGRKGAPSYPKPASSGK
jgi:hypothetical protein